MSGTVTNMRGTIVDEIVDQFVVVALVRENVVDKQKERYIHRTDRVQAIAGEFFKKAYTALPYFVQIIINQRRISYSIRKMY